MQQTRCFHITIHGREELVVHAHSVSREDFDSVRSGIVYTYHADDGSPYWSKQYEHITGLTIILYTHEPPTN